MYEIKRKVGVSHTDREGRIRLVCALDLMQDCSWQWMESEPGFTTFLRDNHLAMVVVSRQVDILRLPVYGEEISARTSIYECKGFSGYRNTILYDEKGSPCIKSWSMGAFLNLKDGSLGKFPAEEAEKLIMDEKVPMDYLDKRIRKPKEGGHLLDPVEVRKNDIDFNDHVNNVRYIETALELLPYNKEVERMRMEYKSPAKLGDKLHPHIFRENNKEIIFLENEEGKPYTSVEFTLK